MFPFLKIGLTTAYFNLSGKTPVPRTALEMYVNDAIINGAVSFIMRLEISSYPHVFLVLNELIFFSTSLVEAYCQLIFGKCLLKLFVRQLIGLVVLVFICLLLSALTVSAIDIK